MWYFPFSSPTRVLQVFCSSFGKSLFSKEHIHVFAKQSKNLITSMKENKRTCRIILCKKKHFSRWWRNLNPPFKRWVFFGKTIEKQLQSIYVNNNTILASFKKLSDFFSLNNSLEFKSCDREKKPVPVPIFPAWCINVPFKKQEKIVLKIHMLCI